MIIDTVPGIFLVISCMLIFGAKGHMPLPSFFPPNNSQTFALDCFTGKSTPCEEGKEDCEKNYLSNTRRMVIDSIAVIQGELESTKFKYQADSLRRKVLNDRLISTDELFDKRALENSGLIRAAERQRDSLDQRLKRVNDKMAARKSTIVSQQSCLLVLNQSLAKLDHSLKLKSDFMFVLGEIFTTLINVLLLGYLVGTIINAVNSNVIGRKSGIIAKIFDHFLLSREDYLYLHDKPKWSWFKEGWAKLAKWRKRNTKKGNGGKGGNGGNGGKGGNGENGGNDGKGENDNGCPDVPIDLVYENLEDLLEGHKSLRLSEYTSYYIGIGVLTWSDYDELINKYYRFLQFTCNLWFIVPLCFIGMAALDMYYDKASGDWNVLTMFQRGEGWANYLAYLSIVSFVLITKVIRVKYFDFVKRRQRLVQGKIKAFKKAIEKENLQGQLDKAKEEIKELEGKKDEEESKKEDGDKDNGLDSSSS